MFSVRLDEKHIEFLNDMGKDETFSRPNFIRILIDNSEEFKEWKENGR